MSSMKPLDPQNRRLIDDVLAGDLPAPELQARAWQTLAPRLGEALPPTAAAASASVATKASLFAGSGTLVKLVVGVVAIGASATFAARYLSEPVEAPSPPPAAAAAAPVVAAAPAAAPSVATAEAPAPTTLQEETELLARAQRALRTGEAAGALVLIDQHQARFPHGELVQAREAARVLSLCALKRTTEAKRVQQQFLRAWPDSPLADRVLHACGKP